MTERRSLREDLARPVDATDERYQGRHFASQAYLDRTAPKPKPVEGLPKELQEDIRIARLHDTWVLLLLFRVFNAITICTFFQPDEYYQGLEPAWALAFGPDSGAWITWEWTHRLRSSLHPILLGSIYKAAGIFGDQFPPNIRTKFLVLLPKFALALQAVVIDYYTWVLSDRLYGPASRESSVVLQLLLWSPWQWFVSTRALSNCLETALTAMALYYWPWDWMKSTATPNTRAEDTKNLKWVVVLAALATMLRPTNILIWLLLTIFTLPYANQAEFFSFVKDASIYGSVAVGASNALDRWFYGDWTFPAANWLYFNLGENLASFYGMNRPDYYFTEGLAWLLTLAAPFAVIAIFQALSGQLQVAPVSRPPSPAISRSLAIVALALPIMLTFISHKEVRFIYPIFPILVVLSAGPIAAFFHPFPSTSSTIKYATLWVFIVFSIVASVYTGYLHNVGLKSVNGWLRAEFENRNLPMLDEGRMDNINHMSVGVLMPCHSIPWRSHLVYPEIDAWALTCEPPLGMSDAQKKTYLDEADVFYNDPDTWIKANMGPGKSREWPEYLLFFGQLEKHMKQSIPQHLYKECWRSFNTLWHDDWRRKGDVIAWCKQQSDARRS